MIPADQVRALTDGAALVLRADRGLVRVRGDDAVDFLHRMVSQDVAGLAVGRAAYACVLDPKAHLLGLALIWRFADHLLLDLPAGAAEAVVGHLERYVIAEDVVFEQGAESGRRHVLVGPEARPLFPDLAPGTHENGVLRMDLGTTPAFEGLGGVFAELLRDDDVPEVAPEALDVLRVQERAPAWGAELGPDVTPLEARLEAVAISWTKGCYPGQEPVAMAYHRGHPPNLLVRLELSDPARAGTALLLDERRVGRITTAVVDPRDGRAKALGYVRYALAEGSAALAVDGGGTARVAE